MEKMSLICHEGLELQRTEVSFAFLAVKKAFSEFNIALVTIFGKTQEVSRHLFVKPAQRIHCAWWQVSRDVLLGHLLDCQGIAHLPNATDRRGNAYQFFPPDQQVWDDSER